MSNKPSTTNEPEPLLVEDNNVASDPTFDTNVEPAEQMETPTAAVTPTTTSDTNVQQRSSQIQSKPKSYILSMKGKSYQYAATQLLDVNCLLEIKYLPQIVVLVVKQVTLKAVMKLWGDKAKTAAVAEMNQLHWRNSLSQFDGAN
jgi:hypothetical protein